MKISNACKLRTTNLRLDIDLLGEDLVEVEHQKLDDCAPVLMVHHMSRESELLPRADVLSDEVLVLLRSHSVLAPRLPQQTPVGLEELGQ